MSDCKLLLSGTLLPRKYPQWFIGFFSVCLVALAVSSKFFNEGVKDKFITEFRPMAILESVSIFDASPNVNIKFTGFKFQQFVPFEKVISGEGIFAGMYDSFMFCISPINRMIRISNSIRYYFWSTIARKHFDINNIPYVISGGFGRYFE